MARLKINDLTFEQCFESAKPHLRRSDWVLASPNIYSYAWRRNWLDDCCKHMKPSRRKSKPKKGIIPRASGSAVVEKWTGYKYRHLTIIGFAGRYVATKRIWTWQCECGNVVESARESKRISCGCIDTRVKQDRTKDYVSNAELLIEMAKSKEEDKLTTRCFELLWLIIIHCGRKMRYKNEQDRQDCEMSAAHDVVKYWRNFDPNISKNPFSYMTTLIMNGYSKAFSELHKKHDGKYVQFLRLDESNEKYF